MSAPEGVGSDTDLADDGTHFDEAFLDALRGQNSWLRLADGTRTRLPVTRWMGTSGETDDAAFDRHVATLCSGPTVDLGCGPGRLVSELIDHGVCALGVDRSAHAVDMTRRRGGIALRRSIFDELPAEGQWDHALLIDGNVGIGGDPFATVARAARLVAPGGTVVVELESGLHGVWAGSVRVESRAVIGPWFPWARAGVGAAREIADQTGLEVGTAHVISGRHLLELHRR
ncbi:class I SAM-dependent methyltransferase [Williamsia serinedens]|uniref:Methyltransferase domain-containing protein n=1 Tax=Williamsia serinedens TaxID=391736 RepID=A0ABT1GXA8_9NOCA|nr:class I SAM-dependent methyltransferase [Williamsia serinedens]MCP2159585.1 Methyltransferase domain-containing protein [Williamsia serinedens]